MVLMQVFIGFKQVVKAASRINPVAVKVGKVQVVVFVIHIHEVGDFQFSACRGFEFGDVVPGFGVEHVEADHDGVALGLFGFFFHGNNSIVFNFHHAKMFGVGYFFEEDLGAFLAFFKGLHFVLNVTNGDIVS